MSYDPAEAALEEQETAFWEQLPKDLHEDAVRFYLGIYGDAIDDRISGLTTLAKSLSDSGYFGPALTVYATTLELMIHYFCVRPMVEGAFLSELWASTLAGWIVKSRPSEQRTLLVAILKLWGINLKDIKLNSGRLLWDTVHTQVLMARNRFVHEGSATSREQVELAMECSRAFREQVIGTLSERLGFTLAKTGKWAEVVRPSSGPGHIGGTQKYTAVNPFRS
jgi:hypothetical protein